MKLETAMTRYLSLNPLTSKRDRDIAASIKQEVADAAVGALSAKVLYEGVDDEAAIGTIADTFCKAVEEFTKGEARPMGHLPPAEVREDGHTYVGDERID